MVNQSGQRENRATRSGVAVLSALIPFSSKKPITSTCSDNPALVFFGGSPPPEEDVTGVTEEDVTDVNLQVSPCLRESWPAAQDQSHHSVIHPGD